MLKIVIERPDGTTYTQEIEYDGKESLRVALARAKRLLGPDYWIVDWYVN